MCNGSNLVAIEKIDSIIAHSIFLLSEYGYKKFVIPTKQKNGEDLEIKSINVGIKNDKTYLSQKNSDISAIRISAKSFRIPCLTISLVPVEERAIFIPTMRATIYKDSYLVGFLGNNKDYKTIDTSKLTIIEKTIVSTIIANQVIQYFEGDCTTVPKNIRISRKLFKNK